MASSLPSDITTAALFAFANNNAHPVLVCHVFLDVEMWTMDRFLTSRNSITWVAGTLFKAAQPFQAMFPSNATITYSQILCHEW
ncbi:MAG: hypothetical protein SPJ13_04695 [Bacteroidales bacterium]|nr:hypothetical protein [Bacteroidales bacterium]